MFLRRFPAPKRSFSAVRDMAAWAAGLRPRSEALKVPDIRTPEQLISAVPPIGTTGSTVRCDGGGGSLGHPAVYVNLAAPIGHSGGTPVGTCGYCGLRFYNESYHSADGGDEVLSENDRITQCAK
eukprot:TRINITY_DN5389_c0_g1_i4.p2 TRINITY_DN5389_c0_g1~~TRINITY_DN5389_c0_g1_i4.p2  ORF type:complete len:125 (-),score=0.65 TRINITY_DN5389_c0_g1_i4:8-382(-)